MTMIRLILVWISLLGLLTGCTAGYISPTDGNPTMQEVYTAAVNGDTTYNPTGSAADATTATLNAAPQPVTATLIGKRLPRLSEHKRHTQVTNALNAQFPMLPNPESQIYIFGHYAGAEQLPVPGHFTVFSLYTQNHYALPNEVNTPFNDGQFNGDGA